MHFQRCIPLVIRLTFAHAFAYSIFPFFVLINASKPKKALVCDFVFKLGAPDGNIKGMLITAIEYEKLWFPLFL